MLAGITSSTATVSKSTAFGTAHVETLSTSLPAVSPARVHEQGLWTAERLTPNARAASSSLRSHDQSGHLDTLGARGVDVGLR